MTLPEEIKKSEVVMPERPKLAVYWGASCGGCEISIVNIHERILELDAAFNLWFCPCLVDTKIKDVEALEDKGIAITLFNGAIMTGENEEMAHLLRRKSGVMVAFGSCASEGCIPGLANLQPRQGYLESIYLDTPSSDNPEAIVPTTVSQMPEGELRLPEFFAEARTLASVVDVDYFMPGCPPEPHRIGEVLDLLVSGAPLPPKGSVIGAGVSNVCHECKRKKEDKKISRLCRTYQIEPDPEKCLLEQGLICMGIATRDGCGGLCPEVNMPCTGCYGPPEGVTDQGARMVAALGSMLDVGPVKGVADDELAARVNGLLEGVPDYAGMFYKYSLPGGILKRMRGK